MSDDDEIALAKSLPAGARRALLAMTDEYVLPGRDTFNASAAFNLSWIARSYGGLAKSRVLKGGPAYRLTHLGQRIQDRLRARAGDQ